MVGRNNKTTTEIYMKIEKKKRKKKICSNRKNEIKNIIKKFILFVPKCRIMEWKDYKS